MITSNSCNNCFSAKIGQTQYKMEQKIMWQETRKAISMQVTRATDNLKLLEIDAKKDLHEMKFIFWVGLVFYSIR